MHYMKKPTDGYANNCLQIFQTLLPWSGWKREVAQKVFHLVHSKLNPRYLDHNAPYPNRPSVVKKYDLS